MLKELASLALACAAFVGFTSQASGQAVAYIGDVNSIDRAALESIDTGAAGPAGFRPTPPPPVVPKDKNDASFLSKLKPAWLFGSKPKEAPVDPFAAAAAQARANVVKQANAAQPAQTASPIPSFVPNESGVTPAAYSDRPRGNLDLRRSTSRPRGILSSMWGDKSKPNPTNKQATPRALPQTAQGPQANPRSNVAMNGPANTRANLRPGVGSQRRWSKPKETAMAAMPMNAPRRQPSRPMPTANRPAPRQLAGPASARSLPKQPTRSLPKEPAGDFLMVSDAAPSAPKATAPKAIAAKGPAPKANPYAAAAAKPKPAAPKKTAPKKTEPQKLATTKPAPAKLQSPAADEAQPSIIASVRSAVPPATEELPPLPRAPEAKPKSEPKPVAVAATPAPLKPIAEEPAVAKPVTPPTAVASTTPAETPRVIDSRSALLAPLVEAAKQTEPTERSKALLVEAHGLANAAVTADDFTAVVKRCRYVLAIDRSPLAKQYANSLAGWALTKRGDALDDAGRYEEAQNDYHEALRCDPECWRAEHRLGVCAARDGDLDEARRRFARTIDINPEFAKPYSNRAALAVQAGDLQAALEDYGRAIEIDPDLAVAHSGRGRVCHMLGLLDEGLRHLDAAELLTPNDPSVATGRGDLLVDLGAYGQALTAYQRAIDIDPNAVAAYRNLAWMLATCPIESFRDGDAALAHAEHAEKLLGKSDDLLLDTKAAALAAAGRFDEATDTLKNAIALAPESDAAAYRERLSLYENGESFISQPVGVRQAAYEGSTTR